MVANEAKVCEVRRYNGRTLEVVIECGLFRMTFSQKNGKTTLRSFQRFDDCKDEPNWIPDCYFKPAIARARAIFGNQKKAQAQQG